MDSAHTPPTAFLSGLWLNGQSRKLAAVANTVHLQRPSDPGSIYLLLNPPVDRSWRQIC
jgi:hypothetical protein